jgi:phage-related protein
MAARSAWSNSLPWLGRGRTEALQSLRCAAVRVRNEAPVPAYGPEDATLVEVILARGDGPRTTWRRISFLRYTVRVSWHVEILDHRVVKELEALAQDVRQRFLRIAGLIEQHGIAAIHEPYVKHLEGKLWEMRMKGKDGIARAVYVTAKGERVVVVHAFAKKTQKTPQAALEIARQRAKEVT